MAGHRRAGHRRELYMAVVSGEYRIPLKMHKCSSLFSASDVAPEIYSKLA